MVDVTALLHAIVAALMSLAAVSAAQPATRVAETVGPTALTEPPLVPTGRCAEWEQTALDAGWTAAQWPTVDRVMWCESRCNAGARNHSGASGLMQIMPMHWHGGDPLDPATNLTMALDVYASQGWRAWSCY